MLGFVRDVWRKVPPVRSMVRTFSRVRLYRVAGDRGMVVGIDAKKTRPSGPDACDAHAMVLGLRDDRFNGDVQAGNVAAACQDAYFPFFSHLSPLF